MMNSPLFDDLDTVPSETREQALFAGFAEKLQQLTATCPGLARHLSEHDLDAIHDRAALQQLPVLRKAELMAAQQQMPPFGGFVDESALEGSRVFMSPGPVFEPQLAGADPWQCARALYAAGIRRGHRVHNAFSYHLTPGGFILDEGARALGCVVFPAGVGGTESQVQAIRQLQSQVYVGTPDYLQVLLDHARGEEAPLSSLTHALVSGGALFPSMRQQYQDQGLHVQQCYATADLGVIAYETATGSTIHPGMVVNENLIVEVLIPGTGRPVQPGQVGEVVVTRLDSAYPLLRFATGDLSAQLVDPSPCGRTQMRLAGWMGRADQRAKVRGMFVDPVQLQVLPAQFPDLQQWRVVITRDGDRDSMQLLVTLRSEASMPADDLPAYREALAESLKASTNLSGNVAIVDELPDDGVVVDDQRNYETD